MRKVRGEAAGSDIWHDVRSDDGQTTSVRSGNRVVSGPGFRSLSALCGPIAAMTALGPETVVG